MTIGGSEVIDFDPLTRISTTLHPSEDGNYLTIESSQDVDAIIEQNKLLYNLYDQRAPFKGDGLHRVAQMDMLTFLKMQQEGQLDDQKAISRWLNDSDNKGWRTRPGRI